MHIDIKKLLSSSPWAIPRDAKVLQEQKQGYLQIKFTWQKAGWRYTARFHEKVPKAKLITYPSWQLSRIHPGKGFGPDHAPRVEEMRVNGYWLKAYKVRYCAYLYNHHKANEKQIMILRQAHIKAKSYH